MMDKKELYNLIYDYKRESCWENARIIFLKNGSLNLYLKNETFLQIDSGKASEILKDRLYKIRKYGKGYFGRKMSLNAKVAYDNGLKPLSKISSDDLKKNGFFYSVDFFRWIVKTWNVHPKEWHHTSVSYQKTKFYDDSTIRYVANCNLELLYRIYKSELSLEEAIKERGITYVKVDILDTLIGGKSGKVLNLNCILCDGIVFYSKKLYFLETDRRLEIIRIFDTRPEEFHEQPYLDELTLDLIKHNKHFYRKK